LTFDGSGTLTDWRFVDPTTGHPLPVRETLAEASHWFEQVLKAPPPRPPRIEFSSILVRGKTTQEEVEKTLGQWRPDLPCGNGGPVPVVKKTEQDSGTVWDWYVDRPSPLFIPPHYLVASFDAHGSLIDWFFQQTYPGGRK